MDLGAGDEESECVSPLTIHITRRGANATADLSRRRTGMTAPPAAPAAQLGGTTYDQWEARRDVAGSTLYQSTAPVGGVL